MLAVTLLGPLNDNLSLICLVVVIKQVHISVRSAENLQSLGVPVAISLQVGGYMWNVGRGATHSNLFCLIIIINFFIFIQCFRGICCIVKTHMR